MICIICIIVEQYGEKVVFFLKRLRVGVTRAINGTVLTFMLLVVD
jgi:hypothetical protein